MGKFDLPKVNEEGGGFVKKHADRSSYLMELNVLRGLKGTGVAPELIAHEDHTRTLRLANAGTDLLSLVVQEERQFSISQLRHTLKGLLQALHELHKRDICHYDVTPRNVCIDGDLCGGFRVKLIDFGLSFSLNQIPESHRTQRIGTPTCLSPEHIARSPEHGKAADIFCAAVTMLQVMEGGGDVFTPLCGKIEPQVAEAQSKVPDKTMWGEIVPVDMKFLLRAMLDPDPLYRRSSLCLSLLG